MSLWVLVTVTLKVVEEKRDAGHTINQCYSNRREHWEKTQVEDEIGFAARTKISASRDENWFLFVLVAVQIHVAMLQRFSVYREKSENIFVIK